MFFQDPGNPLSPSQKPKMVLEQGSGATALEADSGAPEGHSADDSTIQLAQMLIERGIRPRAATQLVETYPNRIQPKIEEYDWIKIHETKRISKWVKGEAPGFLVASIKENYDTPTAFVSVDELEEKARAKKQAEETLTTEYLAQKEQIILEVDATMKLSRKQRVMSKVEEWETTQRKRRMAPTPEERQKRQALYIKNLPTRDQELTERLEDLRRQFEQKVQE